MGPYLQRGHDDATQPAALDRQTPPRHSATLPDQTDMTPNSAFPSLRRAALTLPLLLCGCATLLAPVASTPSVEVPASWSVAPATSGATSLVQWWTRFDDPLLTQLVQQALLANTSVASARAALHQARALREGAAAALGPRLGSAASLQRSARGTAGGDTVLANSFQIGLDASWELDLFGANRSALDASEFALRASAASLGNAQVSVAAEVALNYITLRSTQLRQDIAERNLQSQRQTLQLTQWRLQAGLVTDTDVAQATAAVEQTSALLPGLRVTITQSGDALALLTGQAPAALTQSLAAPGPIPQASAELALGIPAHTLRQRADLRAAEHQVSAALSRVAQADAARWPSLGLGGSLGATAPTLGSLASRSSVLAALLGSVSLPLLDGGAAAAQVHAQQAALEQARVNWQATVLTALSEVEDALAALAGDRERLDHLVQAASAADKAALLARQRYDSGLVDFQTVLETQRTRLATNDSATSARASVSADQVRLYKALGGGWQAEIESATQATPSPRTPSP